MRNAESHNTVSGTIGTMLDPRLAHIRLAALLAAGFATFVVGWLLIGGGDKGSTRAQTSVSGASEAELRSFAASASNPVYWAGPRTGQTYELFKTNDGRVYVRYLPAGVKVGDPRPQFLTVGTYPLANAFAATKRISRGPGRVTRALPGGGIAVFSPGTPSVYFSYPGAKYQVEVYAPSPSTTRSLVLNGQVVPIR
jgi:hypothetical protein